MPKVKIVKNSHQKIVVYEFTADIKIKLKYKYFIFIVYHAFPVSRFTILIFII